MDRFVMDKFVIDKVLADNGLKRHFVEDIWKP
jgi:hypothetical protein